MADDQLGITEISGQLASRMPTKGVPEREVKEAIRNTLHYAKDVGILDRLTDRIEAEAEGDEEVSRLLGHLRQK